jgi:predicted deacylase
MVTHPRRRRIAISPDGGDGFTLVDLVGDRDGPTLSVVGGVHGDEFEGVAACLALAEPLDVVAGGQIVAIVTDPISGERCDVRSRGDGVVVLARRGARVARDDNLVVLAQPEAGSA